MKHKKTKKINLFFNDDETPMNDVKFDLFLKTREVKQISHSLQKVLTMRRDQRVAWINENGEMINQLLDNFLEDSALILDGAQLDLEGQNLSVEFMKNLREALNIISNLLSNHTKKYN